jgi:RNA polymerase sigma-70 factor (ECF subfamily)
LNRAVVVAEVDGPERALELLDELDVDAYHLLHATRADLLRRLGRAAQAAAAYREALARTESPVEREFLQGRLDALTFPGSA